MDRIGGDGTTELKGHWLEWDHRTERLLVRIKPQVIDHNSITTQAGYINGHFGVKSKPMANDKNQD